MIGVSRDIFAKFMPGCTITVLHAEGFVTFSLEDLKTLARGNSLNVPTTKRLGLGVDR